jgi:hypothetical protein
MRRITSRPNQKPAGGFSGQRLQEIEPMTFKTLVTATAMVLASATLSFAQSMPNYGPNAPSTGDSFGKPPSGTRSPGVTRSQRSAYAYHGYWHRHYRYHRHKKARRVYE